MKQFQKKEIILFFTMECFIRVNNNNGSFLHINVQLSKSSKDSLFDCELAVCLHPRIAFVSIDIALPRLMTGTDLVFKRRRAEIRVRTQADRIHGQ